ncbi:MAG: carboxypeptidase-like regulatory domain-containing protein [Bdellovibrionota bacterium]
MKKHHLAASLLGIYLSTACSNGEFDLSRNRYHNVFGVFLTPPNIGKGGFLGRFTTEEGRPIAGARIYLGNERAGITNEKGGFYIGDLTVGKKQIYLVQSEQKMAAISVDIEANKISESEYIRSLPTLSIKGHVSLADEVF